MSVFPGRAGQIPRPRAPVVTLGLPGLDSAVAGVLALGWAGLVGLALAYVSVPAAAVVALAPLAGLGAVALVDSDRTVLFLAAFGLTLTLPVVNEPLPVGESVSVYGADLVLLAAVAAWAPSRFIGVRPFTRPPELRSPLLAAPLFIFSLATLSAIIRGSEQYGTSLVGQPLRLVIYAAVAAVIVDIDARKAWKALTALFYVGAVWQALNGLYHIATGTSQSNAADLSTGGTRFLALDVSLYVAAALFLALLNLRYDSSPRRRALHVAIVLVASFDVLLTFGRGVYIATAVFGSILIVAYRDIRRTLIRALPVLVPLLVLAALYVPSEVRDVAPTFTDRVTADVGYDASVRWREEANEAILKQFHQSPLFGVGFGKGASFTLNYQEWVIDQDPHNGYVFLLGGGGLFLLGAFGLVVAVYLWDTWRRFSTATRPEERAVIVFSVVALFTILLNAGIEPLFTYPSILLSMWALLLLPSIVPRRPRGVSHASGPQLAPSNE